MRTIEPCCAQKQFVALRDVIGQNGTAQFQGYGDMSLTEMLPALLTRYSETEMMIVAPSLPDQAAEAVERWMKRQWARMNGRGKMNVISHLTIIADLSEEKSPRGSEWVKANPFGERLTLVNEAQKDTVILLPDIAITGPINLRYGHNFVCTVTTTPEQVSNLWERYLTIKEEPAQQEAKPVGRKAKKKRSKPS